MFLFDLSLSLCIGEQVNNTGFAKRLQALEDKMLQQDDIINQQGDWINQQGNLINQQGNLIQSLQNQLNKTSKYSKPRGYSKIHATGETNM